MKTKACFYLGHLASVAIQSPQRGAIEDRVLRSMPPDIVTSLTQKFAQKVLPQYSFFHESAVSVTLGSTKGGHESRSTSARSHKDHIFTSFFRRSWISAHHTLEAAVVLLFYLRHACGTILQKFNAGQIFEMSKLFTANFLAIAPQGWADISSYAGIYERLLGSLLEVVFLPSKDPQEHFGPAHLEKLRFERMLLEETSPFDFNLFTFDQDILGFKGIEGTGVDMDATRGEEYLEKTGLNQLFRLDGLGLIF
ncbi:hypothetical protein P280DRAFT_517520 [Massarina eburnea CBS 473.64]|uniref:Uncharacterized protein n=1 Tax=Massarina eburnea CBS 473.64 TaxID=1395130 RepID=A0A6A6S1U3_9PLEO|nr:hypothetical protein P280DRAFT_517520 [Massarina eburnea CBS 473.64]